MSRALPLTVITLAALLSGQAAQAQNLAEGVKACRQMTDSARRLACYDALQEPAQPATAAATAAVSAVAAPAAAPAAVADPVAKFGQESVKRPAGTPELRQLESRIPGKFRGWGPNTSIELENGQVWRIADGSSAYYDLQDPKVIVHRGILGAFYLEIEGIGFQMRVTRVR